MRPERGLSKHRTAKVMELCWKVEDLSDAGGTPS
jgi:hypothetical protein